MTEIKILEVGAAGQLKRKHSSLGSRPVTANLDDRSLNQYQGVQE
ncbi:hypothetical protein [Variovorax sp. dw_308]|nr:hypothetical protein [Variovorax sp. dw_308]